MIPTAQAIPQHGAPVSEPVSASARRRSVAVLVVLWCVLHLGGLFSPGLLDDVDSIYIEAAREMLHRHDYVTPYVDGIRFFDKPPLMYWLAAAGMKVFGEYDWAARLLLSVCVLGLFLAVYALGTRLFSERGGFYAALVLATSLGPYVFTRFYIPDILNALWMTLGIYLLLLALDREQEGRSPRWATWGFAAVMALNLLTKGLIGILFPAAFVLLYAAITGQLRRLLRLPLLSSATLFLLIALPWHVLAALRNPAVAMPPGMGLPARAGWFWFYIVNEHVLRFRGLRIPHDYGQVPLPLFWAMFFLWLTPWFVLLPTAAARYLQIWRNRAMESDRTTRSALTVLLWSGLVLGFFSLSSRQEYYSLPALPALALMAGDVLARAEGDDTQMRRSVHRLFTWFLLPTTTVLALVCAVLGIVSRPTLAGTDISAVLTSNPDQYNLALGHLHDLTASAMGFFRAPLLGMAAAMLGVGPVAWLLRQRSERTANAMMAVSMCGALLCVHTGLARFYPIIGSKGLATSLAAAVRPEDAILLDGELTSGSTLLFYTRHPLLLVNGRVNGPWFGSLWPDVPPIFDDEAALHRAWRSQQHVYLLTYDRARIADLERVAPVHLFASAGGKLLLSNR